MTSPFIFSDPIPGYIVVQRNPPMVIGPYWDLQFAQNELKEIGKRGGSRMMLEITDGAIPVDPHLINGIYQTASNGFDKYWTGWDDINVMVEIAQQHFGKTTDYSHLSNKCDVTLTDFEKFHPTQIKNPPYTFDFLDFSTLHSTFIRFMY